MMGKNVELRKRTNSVKKRGGQSVQFNSSDIKWRVRTSSTRQVYLYLGYIYIALINEALIGKGGEPAVPVGAQ